MSDLFSLLPLGPKQIDQAYPIVQSIMPDLDVNVWREFAEQVGARPEDQAGIITVQNQGYIHGLFSYAVEPHLIHERLLLIDNFFVLDLFNPGAVANALIDAIDGLAARLCCRAIQTALPKPASEAAAPQDWVLDHFRRRGHVLENMTLCKELPKSAASRNRHPGNGGADQGSGSVVTMAHRRERCRFSL
ncbi:MAG: hypothetical protein GVY13_07040 [Alphaproteobacteria bacterium]|jgi:hypothetical protein|nr:hypothetical protein [Alphaproteobacteria bacterium]